MRIAFYAPLKSPDHETPSGDRQMARALIKALQQSGHEVEIVSRLRSFSKTPHSDDFADKFHLEAEKILQRWGQAVPDLWFSYHPYYKAPDFIIPQILKSHQVPVVTAEASLSGKRDADEWVQSQAVVRETVGKAAVNFYFTDRDLDGLQAAVPDCAVQHLSPFIDIGDFGAPSSRPHEPVQLMTMGMMRGGVKRQSYDMLARSLALLENRNWQLTVIGDGPDRGGVEGAFSDFEPGQISWRGEVEPQQVPVLLSEGDIFVWPGFGEAYGLAYLEAQAAGLPVVAQNTHGVPFAVKKDETALLVATGDDEAYASAIGRLINDLPLRQNMARAAKKFIRNERSLEAAALILDRTISQQVNA